MSNKIAETAEEIVQEQLERISVRSKTNRLTIEELHDLKVLMEIFVTIYSTQPRRGKSAGLAKTSQLTDKELERYASGKG